MTDTEHVAVVEELNERIRGESWTADTEMLARCVDLLGAILAQLQAGILTAPPANERSFGNAKYPKPTERPDWLGQESSDDAVAIVSPGELARMFM